MAQTPAKRRSQGDHIDYTPAAAVAAGDVVVIGDTVGIAERAIPANTLGALAVTGVFEMPKINTPLTLGKLVYWDPAGPVLDGTTGAITGTAGALNPAGLVAASSTGLTVLVSLGALNR